MKKNVPIFTPGQFKGLRTSVDPAALPSGFFPVVKNARYSDQTLALRGGTTLVDASGIAQTYKGGEMFEYDGNVYWLFAMSHGSTDVRIYYSVYSSSSWSGPTEVTAASGKYGATRMNEPASGFVTFTGVPGIYGTKYVIVQNGVDDPRIITMGASPFIAKNEAIEAPTQAQGYSPVFGIPDYLDITQSTPTVSASTGADMTFATTLSGAWDIAIANTPVDGDTTTIYNTNTLDLSGSEQVGFIVDTTYLDTLLDYLKIELRDNAGTPNYYTVHDPENSKYDLTIQGTNYPAVKVLWFPIAEHVKVAAMNNIVGLRATFIKDYTASTTENIYIYGIIASGRVPGEAQYAVSWSNSGTRAESPSVNLPNKTRNITVPDIYGSADTTVPYDLEIPIVQGVYYSVTVPTFAPSSANMGKGVDYMDVYRKDPTDDDFYYVGQDQVSAYSGGWAYQSPFSSTVNRDSFIDTVYTWAKDVTKNAPGAYVEPVPIGQAGAFSADRMYFGSRGSSSGRTAVRVSDQRQSTRFRALPISGTPDEAGFEAVLDGEREITAIVPGSSSVVGAGYVYAFTSKAVYTVSGYLVTKISDVGSLNVPAEEDNQLWYLDKNLQVRQFGSGLSNLTRFRVHDQFTGVTPDETSFARWQGRLYCRTGDNTVMVYSDFLGEWESLDTPEQDVAQFINWNFLGESKLYFAATNGDLYQYDFGNDDAGTQITWEVETPDYHNQDYSRIIMGGSQVFATDKDSETMTVTYTASYPADTRTGTVSLDGGGSETSVWKVDKDANGNDPSIAGASVKIKYSATLAGPFKVKGITCRSQQYAGYGATS